MTTLQERLEKQKKSLLKQSLFILGVGNLFGFQFYRVAKDYVKVTLDNIQEILLKVTDNMQNNFFFIPDRNYSQVIVIVCIIAFCYYVIRAENIKKYVKEDGYGSSRWANKNEISK